MQLPNPIGPSSSGITSSGVTSSGISKVHGPHGINAPHAPFRGQATDGGAKTPAAGDSVTISPAAEAALQATETGGIRQDLVGRIRSEIAAGTYETPAKLDVALDRLIDEIG
jgi:negative regulator of flagellin synthesis FlgM